MLAMQDCAGVAYLRIEFNLQWRWLPCLHHCLGGQAVCGQCRPCQQPQLALCAELMTGQISTAASPFGLGMTADATQLSAQVAGIWRASWSLPAVLYMLANIYHYPAELCREAACPAECEVQERDLGDPAGHDHCDSPCHWCAQAAHG